MNRLQNQTLAFSNLRSSQINNHNGKAKIGCLITNKRHRVLCVWL